MLVFGIVYSAIQLDLFSTLGWLAANFFYGRVKWLLQHNYALLDDLQASKNLQQELREHLWQQVDAYEKEMRATALHEEYLLQLLHLRSHRLPEKMENG